MPDLQHSLLKQDIGHLRIIAELYGYTLTSTTADDARDELCASLLEGDLLPELIDSLSPQAESAITDLVNVGGRIPWATFTRQYGHIREMGPGKRDREHPHHQPSSTSEILFYRGILARAFFETDKGAQEFAYIPDDLLARINLPNKNAGPPVEAPGRPASPGEKGNEILADDSILDDATTLLAALRMRNSEFPAEPRLRELLTAAKLIASSSHGITKSDGIITETVKTFLESPRQDALKMLHTAWLESPSFNELKLMPGIVCEGEWTNQPQETREFLLHLLDSIPEGRWWSLNSFIRDIKNKYADFQRPAGDYDSWFIKRASDGQYLRGFSHWDAVDGALIKYFIADVLHWLGQVDLSFAEGSTESTAFRIATAESRIALIEDKKLHVSSQGRITAPRLTPRAIRYQVSRFCEWDEPKGDEFRYRLTTRSLDKARAQGLKVEHLLQLLSRHSGGIPPSLVKALKRWEIHGTEARAETQVVLRLGKPEVLEEMRKSKAAKYLGEALSPTAVLVKSGAIQKVMEALLELGLMAEDLTDPQETITRRRNDQT